jgi:hypothetical protein
MAEDASTRLDSECLTALKERRPEEAVKGMARATGPSRGVSESCLPMTLRFRGRLLLLSMSSALSRLLSGGNVVQNADYFVITGRTREHNDSLGSGRHFLSPNFSLFLKKTTSATLDYCNPECEPELTVIP